MLGKKSRPVIELLTGSLISGNRSGLSDVAAARRTHHLESKAPSPKGLKKSFDFGGVGLGIVAALEKSGDDRNEVPALFSRNLSRSSPIPINSPRNSSRNRESLEEEMDSESLDEYTTIVTRHVPNKSYTKVYCDGRRGDDRSPFRIGSKRGSVFHISPARSGEIGGAPADDFLSSCYLCRKKLQGEDIYMYRYVYWKF